MPKTKILKPERNCWRIEHSPKVAFLVDAADYFKVFRETVKRAERSVLILGWDVDSRVELVRDGEGDDGYPTTLSAFLDKLVREKPELEIHVLMWDFSMIYAFEREWLPLYKLDWRTHKRLHFRLDDHHPMGASQHQKVVVIDDAVAFSGGLDLTKRRWDTSEHLDEDPRRTDPGGHGYAPFHDAQMMVSGPAAAALGELVRWRWSLASKKVLAPPREPSDGRVDRVWPEGVEPDATDAMIGISRTLPAFRDIEETHEVENLCIDSIMAARQDIYIENQYLSSKTVGDALGQRLQEKNGPDVTVVMPDRASGWIEQTTMDVVRARLLRELESEDRYGRLRIYHPVTREGRQNIYVHSKIMVIDDRLARIGSANLSNRSMGLDTECDLSVEAVASEETRRAIRRFRNTLLAEHLRMEVQEVAKAVSEKGRVGRAVGRLAEMGRLEPVDWEVDDELDRQIPETAIIDPERPISPDRLVASFLPEEAQESALRRAWRFALLLVALAGLTIAWRWSPLHEVVNVAEIREWLEELRSITGIEAVVVVSFTVSAVVGVPVTVLIAAVGLAFHPLVAFSVSLAGTLASASASFWIGHAVGRDLVRRLAGTRLNRLSRNLARRGVLAVATVRVVPVAPFAILNVVAGASHVRFWDYFLGTLIGMSPGILALSFYVGSLLDVVQDPRPWKVAVVAGVFVAMLVAVLVVSGYLARKRKVKPGELIEPPAASGGSG